MTGSRNLTHILWMLLATMAPANAGEAEDAGREIATRLCARCHATGQTGASPLDAAPPFRTFAGKWPLESLEEALAEGIVTGHEMPEFTFDPSQISDLLAHIRSLEPTRQ